MTKPKFTPGPWKVVHNELIVAPGAEFENPDQSDYELSQFGGMLIAQQITEANARLIAAAPEMYELLRQLIRVVDESEGEYYLAGEANKLATEADKLIKKINNDE